jgi:small subunit ribosomal protein S16
MVKLRLKRFGKKRMPSYRIIAINSTTRRDARPLEELGFYNPRTKELRLDREGIVTRLKQGAQPTDTVKKLLEREKIFDLLITDLAPQPVTTEISA